MKSPATGIPLSPNRGSPKLNEIFVNLYLPVIQIKQAAVFPLTNNNLAGFLFWLFQTPLGNSIQSLTTGHLKSHITRRISNLWRGNHEDVYCDNACSAVVPVDS